MQKIRTTVKIAGKEFIVSSYEGEEYVQRVAGYVNRKMNELGAATHLPAGQLAVLTAVSVTDDLMKARDELARMRIQLDEACMELEKLRKAEKQ